MTTALLTPHAVSTVAGAATRRLRTTAFPAAQVQRLAAGVGRWAVRALVVAALGLFALVAVGPPLLHYPPPSIATDSLTGTIDVGVVAVLTPLPVDSVEPGMVISYHIPVDDHRLV